MRPQSRERRVWNDLRSSRATPPALAETRSDRAEVYRAALQQFDELISAAETAGVAARPIPLFYAVSQAGRAITAAHRGADDWRHRGHGLRLRNAELALEATIAVDGSPTSSFEVVRQTTNSSALSGAVQLGALVMGLPESADLAIHDVRWPPALRVFEHPLGVDTLTRYTLDVDVVLSPNQVEPARWNDSVREALAHYPTAGGWSSGTHPFDSGDDILHGTTGSTSAHIRWAVGPTMEERETTLALLAPDYRFAGERWLRPSLNHETPALLAPLMTWWVLLYGFSMLARYHPDAWVAMLDIDRNPWAIAVENALDAALDAVPHLVRDAVIGWPLLL